MSSYPEMKDLESAAATKVELYREHLVKEGFRPEVDEDGDLAFRHEGKTLCLFIDEEDSSYFRLSLPAFYSLDTPEEESRALRIVNKLNTSYKVAKVVLHDGCIWVNIEMFLDDPAAFRPVFERCLGLIGSVAADFRVQMAHDERGGGRRRRNEGE